MPDVFTLALVGVIPIGVAFVLPTGLRWSAAHAMGVGWLLAGGIGGGRSAGVAVPADSNRRQAGNGGEPLHPVEKLAAALSQPG